MAIEVDIGTHLYAVAASPAIEDQRQQLQMRDRDRRPAVEPAAGRLDKLTQHALCPCVQLVQIAGVRHRSDLNHQAPPAVMTISGR